MTAVWSIQEWSFRTPFFLGDRLLEYRQHTFPVSLERPLQVAQGLLCHPVVAPALRNDRPSFRAVPVGVERPARRRSPPWPGRPFSSWAPGAPCRPPGAAKGAHSRSTAAGSLALMFAMHLTLGREPFLYALSVLPLLLVLAAASALPGRGLVLVRATACVLLWPAGSTTPASSSGRRAPPGSSRRSASRRVRAAARGGEAVLGNADPHLGQVPGDFGRGETQLRRAARRSRTTRRADLFRSSVPRHARGGGRRWALP